MSAVTILKATWDPKLFGPWFKDPKGWAAWLTLLKAVFALPMTDVDLAVFRQCTGRTEPPSAPAKEVWLICGRRAGKSFMLALIATYLATFHTYRQYLTPGERGVIAVVARDRRQGKVIFSYIRALLTQVPLLAQQIERETADAFELAGDVSIEIMTASSKSIRGRTVVACLADEIAFWPVEDAADPDYAVLDAVRPSMATIPNAMLLCASSPYARKGALFDAYVRHYGKDNDPVLVWKASTRVMNPTVSQSIVDAALERDADDASSEWLAEFRNDLASFISRETVMACVEPGMFERPPQPGVQYESFIDPSGGSNDSMTCAIGHLEAESLVVVDCVREIKAPFDPESAVDEFAALLQRYGVRNTNGDRYAAAWVSTAFEKRGVAYRHCELPRSALYLNLLPHLNSRSIRLLDNPRIVNQIASLERRTARGARDSIDHPRDQHDDLANVIAGLAYVSAQRPVATGIYLGSYEDPFSGLRAAQERQEGRFRSLREEAESGIWSAPCTLTAAQLASTEPSPEALRRWEARAIHMAREEAEERRRKAQFHTSQR
jgi:hypothetical protein